MAACYDNDVIDVTALYVYTGAPNCNSFVACITGVGTAVNWLVKKT